jgi:hypothetical protein
MSTKWLQERGNDSKNGVGITLEGPFMADAAAPEMALRTSIKSLCRFLKTLEDKCSHNGFKNGETASRMGSG